MDFNKQFQRNSDLFGSEIGRQSFGRMSDSMQQPQDNPFSSSNFLNQDRPSYEIPNRDSGFYLNMNISPFKNSIQNRDSNQIMKNSNIITPKDEFVSEFNNFQSDFDRNSLEQIFNEIPNRLSIMPRPMNNNLMNSSQKISIERQSIQNDKYDNSQVLGRQSIMSQENRMSFPSFNFEQNHSNRPSYTNENNKLRADDTIKEEEKSQDQIVPDVPGCNCKKSKCLKLYCECFSQGKTCLPSCKCEDCSNKDANDIERNIAIQSCLQKNPLAFQQQVTNTNFINFPVQMPQMQYENIQQIKGCTCKKTKCLKKYCECYNKGQKCSYYCRCENCQNVKTEENECKKKKVQCGGRPLTDQEQMNMLNKKLKSLDIEEQINLERKKQEVFIIGRGIIDKR